MRASLRLQAQILVLLQGAPTRSRIFPELKEECLQSGSFQDRTNIPREYRRGNACRPVRSVQHTARRQMSVRFPPLLARACSGSCRRRARILPSSVPSRAPPVSPPRRRFWKRPQVRRARKRLRQSKIELHSGLQGVTFQLAGFRYL